MGLSSVSGCEARGLAARIEVPTHRIRDLLQLLALAESEPLVARHFGPLGFTSVSLDLEGSGQRQS